jgi:hypothetical protein
MSKIEVDAIDKQSGSTLTLGGSGTAVTLACGATQSGFGRAGSVDWVTTPVTSTPTTGVSGKGYFVNSTGAIKTINLPASPSAGDIMAVVDYAGTSATYNITIGRNGSNINGAASDLTIDKENSGITLVYVDGTQGWKGTETTNLNDIETQAAYVAATGGTITTVCTNFKVHTFTGPGTFCVSCAGNSKGSNAVSYLVVAGGGSAGNNYGGGGGGGGFREGKSPQTPYTASPIACTSGPNAGLPVTAQAYSIVVGGGGTATTPSNTGNKGSDSSFSTITSTGGGFGGGAGGSNAGPGGSGGGSSNNPSSGGTGNDPSVSPSQGNNGETSPLTNAAGGGGGAGEVGGTDGQAYGGDGAPTEINGSATFYAGGGGGYSNAAGGDTQPGGQGGGGGGPSPANPSGAGGTNTGGGSGYSNNSPNNFAGGSGIVIIRYKFQ